MDKYKKYYGILLFIGVIAALLYISVLLVQPAIDKLIENTNAIEKKEEELNKKNRELNTVTTKLQKLKNSNLTAPKKLYSPIDSDLGNDTLFFTLYNDMIEMVHSNSIKIKSINYTHNPENDEFVKFGKDLYFVCDIKMELVTNYVNLGKLLEDIQQYPYYIKVNGLKVNPYTKDKKILLAELDLRLYSHTSPQDENEQ